MSGGAERQRADRSVAGAQPNTMELLPPGGASTRDEGLSVMKLLRAEVGG